MSWSRIDDKYAQSPKMVALGDWFELGMALDVAGICWSNLNETDGKVPKTQIARLVLCSNIRIGSVRVTPDAVAQRLVAVGRWVDCGDHYEIHDFLDYNPSKEQRDAKRDALVTRVQRHRNAKRNALPAGYEHGCNTPPEPDPVPDPNSSSKRETRVPREPPPSRPSGSKDKPAGPDTVSTPSGHRVDTVSTDPPNIKQATTEALSGGMLDPDHNTAREVHEHYRGKFSDPKAAPSWGTCREAIVRAVVWCRFDGHDACAVLRLVIDYCADPKTHWRERGQGTPDRLHKVRSIFGDAEHVAETVGTLIAEATAWSAAPPAEAPKARPLKALADYTLDELVLRHPEGWDHECLRRKPDVTTWPDGALYDTDVPGAQDELQKRLKARRPVMVVAR